MAEQNQSGDDSKAEPPPIPPPPPIDWGQDPSRPPLPPWATPPPYVVPEPEDAVAQPPEQASDPWRIPPQPPWNLAAAGTPPPVPGQAPPAALANQPPYGTAPRETVRDDRTWPTSGPPPAATVPRSSPLPPEAPRPGGAVAPPTVRFDEPWRREAPPRRRPGIRRRYLVAAVAVAAAALLGGGFVVLSGGGKKPAPARQAALPAGRLFTTDPAAKTDGRDQELTGVAAAGSTVVAIGDEFGSANTRAEFLVSTDGGSSYRLADVRTSDGQEPPYGDVPRVIAGGVGGWVALSGGAPGGTVVWTSANGRTWTRQPDSAGAEFGRGDRVFRVTRTSSGFVAVGDTSVRGDFSDATPVVWLSADGRSWERIPSDQLRMSLDGGAFSLVDVASVGNTVLAYGWALNGDKKVVADGVWRSADGGRTWAPTAVPRPKGGGPTGMAITATPAGFVVVRGAAKSKGKKFYGVVFGSADAQSWTPIGEIDVPGYEAVLRMAGSDRGLAAVVATGGDKVVLARSADGRSWTASGDVPLPAGRTFQGVAVTAGATIAALRDGSGADANPVLAVRDTQGKEVPVDLSRVPGAVQADQTVTSLASGGGRVVAVGSTNGDAAAWSSTDGTRWVRGAAEGTAFARPHKQRLYDVTWGDAGWLAVGEDAGPDRPLVVASADGATWTAVDGRDPFKPGVSTVAAASGPKGYVIVGQDGPSAAAWHSADLKSWRSGDGDLAGKPDARRWMRSAVGGTFGYVAVGGLDEPAVQPAPQDRPAVWTSADGERWTLGRVPLPGGAVEASFDKVVAGGGVLVASGTARSTTGGFAFAFSSRDGGRTWQEARLPGTTQTALGTPAAATPRGFVIAGIAGAWGHTSVIVWTSRDGRSWTAERPAGPGLSGRGDHWISDLTAVGGDLLAVGVEADHRGEQVTLWRRPLP